jgi:hypothetical protein
MCALETPRTSRAANRSLASPYRTTSAGSPSNADVVSTFLSRTTWKSLVHKLGCRKPRTTRELLDIATNHASSKEAARVVFTDGWAKGKGKREDQDEGPSSRQEKRKKDD